VVSEHVALRPGQRPPRSLSLRATLLLIGLAAGVYAGALPLYLDVRVRAPALALSSGTGAVILLQDDLSRRQGALHRAAAIARELNHARARPSRDTLATLARLVALAGGPADARPLVDLPLPVSYTHLTLPTICSV